MPHRLYIITVMQSILSYAALSPNVRARLCRLAGGELGQIQSLLGHASVQRTERYLGSKPKASACDKRRDLPGGRRQVPEPDPGPASLNLRTEL
jgi:hypothetical protein